MASRCLWVFDLDDTLHAATPHIFPSISRQMTAYLREYLGLGEIEANALRQRYWLRYGATLQGLIRHHGIDPEHFLYHTHQFDNLRGMLVYEPRLRSVLSRLPGEKIIYSNAPVSYIDEVLQLIGIRACFDAVIGIEETGFRPKPQLFGYYYLLKRFHVPACQCVMVEDSLDNLRAARRVGMKTVWIHGPPLMGMPADLRLNSVCDLPRYVNRLLGDRI
ncbi:MAG: pyrimidine 5'-nucleotidase [Proteobacteria bacterium]|nr:pyrimidine 5'-nucleotidase [Pseudomonadota bacterium]